MNLKQAIAALEKSGENISLFYSEDKGDWNIEITYAEQSLGRDKDLTKAITQALEKIKTENEGLAALYKAWPDYAARHGFSNEVEISYNGWLNGYSAETNKGAIKIGNSLDDTLEHLKNG